VVRSVLFDVDGVLVHPWRFRDYLVREHSITPEMTAPFFRGPFVACTLGHADLDAVLPPFLRAWGWRGGTRSFIDAWLTVEDAPFWEVLEIARQLRRAGLQCFIASTQERHRAHYLVNQMGFGDLFDRAFFSCDLGVSKPDPAFFEEVSALIASSPEGLLLVDDAPENADAALAAGWNSVLFVSPDQLRRALSAVV
jgi:putative hydrolase of the HAD superfamily